MNKQNYKVILCEVNNLRKYFYDVLSDLAYWAALLQAL